MGFTFCGGGRANSTRGCWIGKRRGYWIGTNISGGMEVESFATETHS